jgi:allophanate hydrolase
LYAPAWRERLLIDVARLVEPASGPGEAMQPVGGIRLVVAGAHLKGQPLESQLLDLGAVWERTTSTAATYRLFALPGGPPHKPALIHDPAGGAIEVDVWRVSLAALGRFLTMVPPPLALGTVTLADGTTSTGFVAEPRALDGATEITHLGGWRAYIDQAG